MTEAARKSKTLKISSKRQITIPAEAFHEMNFGEYALCTWTDSGILIEPLPVEDEDVSVMVLKKLIEKGIEGDALIAQYRQELMRARYDAALISESERDIAEGNLKPFEDVQKRMRAQYDI
ncbi:MAG: delta-aminolevulinic acid dehydratase [Slackia sp.]|nr:delta-aminolevulinic acid dehydratase [Slackia sp.]